MEIFELSRLIHGSCDRIHQAATHLYESIHDDGIPTHNQEGIESHIFYFRETVNNEIYTIRTATSEYREGFDE